MTGRPLRKAASSDGSTARDGVGTTIAAKTMSMLRIASIPDQSNADTYIGRTFPGDHSDFDIFDIAMASAFNVLLEGPTGPGKTSAVLAWAADRRKHFYSLSSSSGFEPSQVFGRYIPDESNTSSFVWVDGGATDIIRNGGVLLLNEVNFIPDRISTVLFGTLDKRREMKLVDHRGETIRAHRPDCWCGAKDCSDKWVLIVADMNPDYEGTRPLNKAFRNRFAIQLDWGYDADVERLLISSPTLLSLATQLRREVDAGTYETPVATNMLMEFEGIVGKMGLPFAVANFINRFLPDERASVRRVFDTMRGNFEAEYLRGERKNAANMPIPKVDESKLDVEQLREYRKYGGYLGPRGEELWSPAYGLYGKDWVYDDEDQGVVMATFDPASWVVEQNRRAASGEVLTPDSYADEELDGEDAGSDSSEDFKFSDLEAMRSR